MSINPSSIKIFVATAVSLAMTNVAHAKAQNCSDIADKTSTQECQCTPIYQGKNLVKPGQTDCASAKNTHSCAGQNAANDMDAWILLPAGVCDKIMTGKTQDLSVDEKTKLCNRIEC
jgi:uncharacterized membrane protein